MLPSLEGIMMQDTRAIGPSFMQEEIQTLNRMERAAQSINHMKWEINFKPFVFV